MELSETEKILIDCLECLEIEAEEIEVTMLILSTEKRQEAMLDWMIEHFKENPTQEQIQDAVVKIVEEVE